MIRRLKQNSNGLTKREKSMAHDICPTYGGYRTWKEVSAAKLKARGSFWHLGDFAEWVAFTPKGKRIFLGYDDEWKNDVKKCAELIAKGKVREANSLYESFFNGCCFKRKEKRYVK